jgi:hypothetical protein
MRRPAFLVTGAGFSTLGFVKIFGSFRVAHFVPGDDRESGFDCLLGQLFVGLQVIHRQLGSDPAYIVRMLGDERVHDALLLKGNGKVATEDRAFFRLAR